MPNFSHGSSHTGGRLTIDLDALQANYTHLAWMARPAKCAAVVKADAYGLAAHIIGPALERAGCKTFFVALAHEALRLRHVCPDATIYVFDGVYENSVDALIQTNITPVLNSLDQIELWARLGERKPCAVQIDTGMNRFGLTVDEAAIFSSIHRAQNLVNLKLILSHLACGSDPNHRMNAEQLKKFQHVRSLFPDIESSLANSAGTLMGGDFLCDWVRPGIAIYGGEAISTMANPMKPVVTLHARIGQIRHAKKGESVSYGASHVLTRDTKIATVIVGYADGYPRSGSGSGIPLRANGSAGAAGYIDGYRVPLLGRVTMDICMFDVTDVPDDVLAKGWVELIGKNITLDEAAKAAGTVGYELLTSLGSRYERSYISTES